MRARSLVAVLLAGALLGCGATISEMNARPDKYYQEKVTFTGRLTRAQQVTPEERLLEVADVRGRRLLVRATGPLEVEPGGWVKVTGLLVPEARVGDRVLYDVVVSDDVQPTSRPWFEGIM